MSNGIYTDTTAFKRILLKHDIYKEAALENRRKIQSINDIRSEQEHRADNAKDGSMIGLGIGLMTGNLAVANMLMNIGSTIGMEQDNTSYESFVPDKYSLMGKFYTAEGADTYDLLIKEAQNLEDQQDNLKEIAGLNVIKDAVKMTIGATVFDEPAFNMKEFWSWDKDIGFFPNIGEKLNLLEESKKDYKLPDFIDAFKGWRTVGDVEDAKDTTDLIVETMILNNPEDVFADITGDEIDKTVDILGFDEDKYTLTGNEGLDKLNQSLIDLGYGTLGEETFNYIRNYNQNLIEEDLLNEFKED